MYQYVFGPVQSRRLGLSLGVDLLGSKICTFNCIYCEVRKTDQLTVERKEYVSAKTVIKELDLFFTSHPDIPLNYITFSGQGEPTLNSEISSVIKHIKRNYNYPVCVLTNGSLLNRQDVRNDLLQADLIIPSLDAVSDKAYKKINLPHSSVTVDDIVEGIKSLRAEFSGEIWLEILFVEGINAHEEELALLKEKIKEIQPDKLYVNTIYRPPSFNKYQPIKESQLSTIQSDFERLLGGNEMDVKNRPTKTSNQSWDQRRVVEQLKPMLNIRPCSLEDLSDIFCSYQSHLKEDQLKEILDDLIHKDILKVQDFDKKLFYCLKQ